MRFLSVFRMWGLKISKAKDHTISHCDFSPCISVDISWLQPANLDPCPCTVCPVWPCFPAAPLHGRPRLPSTSVRGVLHQTAGQGLRHGTAAGLCHHTSIKHQGAPALGTLPTCIQASDLPLYTGVNPDLCWYTTQHFPSFHSTENTPEKMYKGEAGILRKKKATQSELALRKATVSFDEQEVPDREWRLGATTALCC